MRAPFHVLKFKNTFYGYFRATEIVNEAWRATLAAAQVLKAKTNLLVLLATVIGLTLNVRPIVATST